MTNIADHDVEPAHMQADVISRRTEGKLSTRVSEFRLVVLAGMLVAVAGTLAGAAFALDSDTTWQVLAVVLGLVLGVVFAFVARITGRI